MNSEKGHGSTTLSGSSSRPANAAGGMMNNEKGHALPLALFALLVGMLVITPFLIHASTGVIARGIYGEAMIAQNSAEAGIEYAIWRLQKGERPPSLHFPINDKPVNVTIERIVDRTYKIRSTADRTIIEADVRVPIRIRGNLYLVENEERHGNFIVEGNVYLEENARIYGNVYAEGNVELCENARIYGHVIAEGNVELGENARIRGNVYAEGNVELGENAEIYGNVIAGRDVELCKNARIQGTVRLGGYLELGENARIYRRFFPPAKPPLFTGILSWQIN